MDYPMSRRDRLERWASVLEHSELANLTPFRDIEFLSPAEREQLRVANSPLTLAYQDPALRRAGLGSDGSAMALRSSGCRVSGRTASSAAAAISARCARARWRSVCARSRRGNGCGS
jgi:hypothetical protein